MATNENPEKEDVAAYLEAMSLQLAEVAVLARMDKAAQLLEAAAKAARAQGQPASG